MNSAVLALGELGLGANSTSDWYEALVFFYKNPSLGHNFGENGRQVVLGELGLGANSTSDWYEALVFFYKNPSLGHNFGENGRQVVEDNFNQKAICQKLVKVFQNLI
jgi:glycosyltransferase involved in cell wall biosynthesis